MKRFLRSMAVVPALALLLGSAGEPARAVEATRHLEKANVLPLALDDDFQFRKINLFFQDPEVQKNVQTQDEMMSFERQRLGFKAVTGAERRAKYGNYFTFSWRAKRKADVTLRLEYRQENLGSFVQAKEIGYANVKGNMTTKFDVIGDDYRQDGRVIAWRAVLIENGRIVGLTQSFLWN